MPPRKRKQPRKRRVSMLKLDVILRKEIRRQNLSQYKIAQDTGIKQPSLSRFLNGGSLKMETAGALLDYLGYEITRKA